MTLLPGWPSLPHCPMHLSAGGTRELLEGRHLKVRECMCVRVSARALAAHSLGLSHHVLCWECVCTLLSPHLHVSLLGPLLGTVSRDRASVSGRPCDQASCSSSLSLGGR